MNLPNLSQAEAEIMRLLYFSPNHTATIGSLCERSFLPNTELEQALNNLIEQEEVLNVKTLIEPNEHPCWTPSAERLRQMKQFNAQADQQLRQALDLAKRNTGENS